MTQVAPVLGLGRPTEPPRAARDHERPTNPVTIGTGAGPFDSSAMKWKVIWSPLALTRVREQTEYIARYKPAAAENWADGIFGAADRLQVWPG